MAALPTLFSILFFADQQEMETDMWNKLSFSACGNGFHIAIGDQMEYNFYLCDLVANDDE